VDTTVWVDYLQGLENAETDWLNTELNVLDSRISSFAKCCRAFATTWSRRRLRGGC
jgi:hypothetical protein